MSRPAPDLPTDATPAAETWTNPWWHAADSIVDLPLPSTPEPDLVLQRATAADDGPAAPRTPSPSSAGTSIDDADIGALQLVTPELAVSPVGPDPVAPVASVALQRAPTQTSSPTAVPATSTPQRPGAPPTSARTRPAPAPVLQLTASPAAPAGHPPLGAAVSTESPSRVDPPLTVQTWPAASSPMPVVRQASPTTSPPLVDRRSPASQAPASPALQLAAEQEPSPPDQEHTVESSPVQAASTTASTTASTATSTTASTAAPADAPPAQTSAQIEELARRLYDPIVTRLRADLLVDRDRVGLRTDLW